VEGSGFVLSGKAVLKGWHDNEVDKKDMKNKTPIALQCQNM
jgi:hypothetical protein